MNPDRQEVSQSERLQRLRQAMYSRSLSKNIRTKPRRDLEQPDFAVPEDFTLPEELTAQSSVAPRVIGWGRYIAKLLLIFSIVFCVTSVAAFVYFFTAGGGSLAADPGNIDISIRGPLQVAGGERSELQIVVTNKNRAPLELADLIVRFPKGTRSPTDFITELSEQRISLGHIDAGGQQQGTIPAVFVGEQGTTDTVKVELEYRVQESNAIFVAESSYGLTFGSGPLSVAVKGNNEAISGQRVALTVEVRAGSGAPLRDALLEVQYPFGFEEEQSSPAPTRGSNMWELGDMRPGEVREIVVRGTLEGQERDERIFTARTGIRKTTAQGSIDVILSESAHHMTLAQPFVGVAIVVNKESGDEAVTVKAADNVSVTLGYKNNLTVPIENVVLVARLDGVDLPGASFKTSDGYYRSSDRTVFFDKTTTKGLLGKLQPGASGTVSFSFAMPTADALARLREGQLKITVHAAGKRVNERNVPETLQASISRGLKLASDVRIIAQGFYYQNPLGVSSGPLPPKVDEETTYGIVFTAANSSNVIQQGKVTAQLPPYVRWVGVSSPRSEKIYFNSSDGSIMWDLGELKAGVGVGDVPPRQMAFMVGFTPSSSQIGEQPPLVTDIILTGKDTFTGDDVTTVHPDISTNLLDDTNFASTEATVVE